LADFLRPDGDDTVGSWTNQAVSGTNVYQAIDEATSETADYAQSEEQPNGSAYSVSLGNPASGVDTSAAVVVNYDYGKDGNGKMDLQVDLMEGATTIASATHNDVVDGSTGAITLSSGEKSSVSNWDNVTLKFTATDGYVVGGHSPELVADFVNEYYRKNDTDTTFDGLFTYTRGSALSIMYDSSGNLVWSPHNELADSQEFDPASTIWSYYNSNNGVQPTITDNYGTAPDGTTTATRMQSTVNGDSWNDRSGIGYINFSAPFKDYEWTFRIWIKATNASDTFTIRLVAPDQFNNVVVTDQWQLAEVTSTGNFIRIYQEGTTETGNHSYDWQIWGAHLYRSDFGGMANNLDRGDSYVPTAGSVGYLPRRSAYTYNGTSWVNSGIQLEAAATNLITESSDFATTWTTNNAATISGDATGPDGVANSAFTLTDNSAAGTGEVYLDYAATVSTSTIYTFSVYLKASGLSWAALGTEGFTTPANGETYFNLGTPAVGTEATGHTGVIEDLGDFVRCSITFTTDGTDTTGNVRIYLADADTDNVVDLDGTSSVIVYGAQLEATEAPSSYIPTSGSTLTRDAETLTIGTAVHGIVEEAPAMSWYTDLYVPHVPAANGEVLFYGFDIYKDINELHRQYLWDNAGNFQVNLRHRHTDNNNDGIIIGSTPDSAISVKSLMSVEYDSILGDANVIRGVNGSSLAESNSLGNGFEHTQPIFIGSDYTGSGLGLYMKEFRQYSDVYFTRTEVEEATS